MTIVTIKDTNSITLYTKTCVSVSLNGDVFSMLINDQAFEELALKQNGIYLIDVDDMYSGKTVQFLTRQFSMSTYQKTVSATDGTVTTETVDGITNNTLQFRVI